MDKKTDSTYTRLPSKLKLLVHVYARENGLTCKQAIIHLVARGLHFEKMYREFHIEQYTENFFEEGVRFDKNSDQK